jgi:circadian clock protein KaiC
MIMHLRQMSFFDSSLVPDQVAYISAYHALEDEGLKGAGMLISREIRARKSALLVLDGASAIEVTAQGEFELKRFTHELQTVASATGCTMILLTTVTAANRSTAALRESSLVQQRPPRAPGRTSASGSQPIS